VRRNRDPGFVAGLNDPGIGDHADVDARGQGVDVHQVELDLGRTVLLSRPDEPQI
jgi:hypothetical protein